MPGWFQRWRDALTGRAPSTGRVIPQDLWDATLQAYPFLTQRTPEDLTRLRELAGHFLDAKEFYGAQGLQITDAMAIAVATQACLPVLHLPGGLDWYDDFVGIVMQPGEVVARREVTDEAGVVHRYSEVLSGEAMDRGPIMLSWQDVAGSGASAMQGYNVVIHEFAHKIDMRGGEPDGCPRLPAGFMGTASGRAAREHWLAVIEPAYEAFREKVIIAERFGGVEPWLNAYGAQSLTEFFAVACEGYFVNREAFERDFAGLAALFDTFFNPHAMSSRA